MVYCPVSAACLLPSKQAAGTSGASVESRFIRIRGARQHNLRNLDVDIPRDRLVVITGVSGSGKSSLAFDTIYAEGQRRYVESLSVHARLFLEQVGKPDVDLIEGLPPTLAIEQLAAAANPRSTVATTTEIYDFLRLLFARVGQPHCPQCRQPIYGRTVDQIVDAVRAYPAESKLMLLAPLARKQSGELKPLLRRAQREGFVRVRLNGALRELQELSEITAPAPYDLEAVVDRLVLRPDLRARLADAIELALKIGEGRLIVSRADASAKGADVWRDEVFSELFTCTTCGIGLDELSPRAFSFNSPYGACVGCHGLGTTLRFDPDLIVPNEDLALAGGAIAPWREGKRKLHAQHEPALEALCAAQGATLQTPFKDLSPELRQAIMFGTPAAAGRGAFVGVVAELERQMAAADEAVAAQLAAFQSEQVCPACHGGRLKPPALAVTVHGMNIHELTKLPIEDATYLFEGLRFEGETAEIAEPILREVRRRLRFMFDIGLGYLTLNRPSGRLSGGEAQRIRLSTQLGSGLVGVCYVLDEPTIGLHQRDNERLLAAIRRLVSIGNSVIVVEHDEDVIRAADYLIDIGPGAGLHGGKLIAHGLPAAVLADPNSVTGRYLCGEYQINLPEQRRKPRRSDLLTVVGAAENNLKGMDVSFPLEVFCAVTGVSGSGKSSLVMQTLVPALRRRLERNGGSHEAAPTARTEGRLQRAIGKHERLIGAHKVERVIEVDQTPIGRTPRSNPATFTGVFDEIRRLYASTKEGRIRGYSASRFSFNAKGGRCESCQGQGVRRIEMHFLPDVFVECGECKGTRYNRETLEVRYRGKSIADVLEMRVEEALHFFDNFPKIRAGVQSLSDVGLGYLRIGQPSNTLSGGEAQRVKLAAELCKPATARTLYVFDEPTTGLHFADIDTLLIVLNRLVEMGNTVLVIEHNLDVIKTADWVIDMGPEGGAAGGQIVIEGTPEQVAACPASHTGQHLKSKLAAAPSPAA